MAVKAAAREALARWSRRPTCGRATLIVVGSLKRRSSLSLFPTTSIPGSALRSTACLSKMGFRTGFVLVSVSFLYGVLFIASIYDFPLLYGTATPHHYEAAELFYLGLYNGPTAISALLHGVIGVGLLALIAKIHRWTETAKFFDGFSLILFIAAIAMYGGVQIPNIRLLADPSNKDLLLRSSIRTQRESVAKAQIKAGVLPKDTVVDLASENLNEHERQSALSILGAGNTIVMMLLAGIFIMQASEWWIERGERMEDEKRREAEMKAVGLSTSPSTPVVAVVDTSSKTKKKEKKTQ